MSSYGSRTNMKKWCRSFRFNIYTERNERRRWHQIASVSMLRNKCFIFIPYCNCSNNFDICTNAKQKGDCVITDTKNVQSNAGEKGFIGSLHINNMFKRWNEPQHTTKGNKCYANIIYIHVSHIYSLQKERWLHYMYRITEMNDIMYNIYNFSFKIIQL